MNHNSYFEYYFLQCKERELQNNSHQPRRRVSPLVEEAGLVAGPLGAAGVAKRVAGRGSE